MRRLKSTSSSSPRKSSAKLARKRISKEASQQKSRGAFLIQWFMAAIREPVELTLLLFRGRLFSFGEELWDGY